MDSDSCWGESSHQEEHDCGPSSGVVLPAVYSLDPAQVRPNLSDGRYHPLPTERNYTVGGIYDTNDSELCPGC